MCPNCGLELAWEWYTACPRCCHPGPYAGEIGMEPGVYLESGKRISRAEWESLRQLTGQQ